MDAQRALWDELLALAAREGDDRSYLEKLLGAWTRERGVESAALYLDGEAGGERLAAVGRGEYPAELVDGALAGLVTVGLPGGRLAYRDAVPPGSDPLLLLLASALRTLRMKRQLKQQRFQVDYRGVELEALYEVGLAIASTLDPRELAEVILLRAVSLLDARRGALYLLEDGRYRLSNTIGGEAIAEIEAADPRVEVLLAAGVAAIEILPEAAHLLAVPIQIDGRPRGLLAVADKESRQGVGPFPPADRRTLGLFANQAAIALENARLHVQALEKERLEREMELAAEIQRRILPKSVPTVGGFDLYGWNRPARQVGGDYFDFLPLQGGRLGLTVGDVSGKGIAAALLVSTLHSAIRLLLDRIEVGPTLLQRLNQHILDSSAPNKFITLLLAELEPASAVVRYLNAGHNPGVLVGQDGRVLTLGPGGLPLGLMPRATYREERLELRPGDLLCLYTDGITECMTPEDEEFGIERLTALLREHNRLPLSELAARIEATTDEFARGQPQGDDQTLLLLRRL
ncbi:MAG: PP2C family protein-serine/threonine phosphatase [Acidobacteriota bacterium]